MDIFYGVHISYVSFIYASQLDFRPNENANSHYYIELIIDDSFSIRN